MSQETIKAEEKVKATGKKTAGTIILALLAILVFLGVFYFKTISGNDKKEVKKKPTVLANISTITLSQEPVIVPYCKTDIPSVVYTADSAGAIKFFGFDGVSYKEIPESGNFEITVPLSGQEIPATVHYIERDGVLTGFGLYTPDTSDAEVFIYDFVMFRITNLPSAYAEEGKCLLLAHTDITQAYSDAVVWEESYILNREDNSLTRFLLENNRTVDLQGAMRPDFCRITDTELASTTSILPFFSGRNYEISQTGADVPIDIFIKNGKAKDVDAVHDVLDTYAKPLEDGGFVYIQKTDSGFNTVKYQNGENTVINMFYNTYGESYVRKGDWILSKEDGRIYSTYNDTVIEPEGYKINPLQFEVSPDGKYVAMLGTVSNAMDYQLYVYNTETGAFKSFAENNYAEHRNLRFANNTTITFYTLSATSGFENVVVDISSVK